VLDAPDSTPPLPSTAPPLLDPTPVKPPLAPRGKSNPAAAVGVVGAAAPATRALASPREPTRARSAGAVDCAGLSRGKSSPYKALVDECVVTGGGDGVLKTEPVEVGRGASVAASERSDRRRYLRRRNQT
jgi:hypothetical protein